MVQSDLELVLATAAVTTASTLLPLPPSSPSSYLWFLHVCLCKMHVEARGYVGVPMITLHLTYSGRVSHLNPELTTLTIAAIPFVPGILSLCLQDTGCLSSISPAPELLLYSHTLNGCSKRGDGNTRYLADHFQMWMCATCQGNYIAFKCTSPHWNIFSQDCLYS